MITPYYYDGDSITEEERKVRMEEISKYSGRSSGIPRPLPLPPTTTPNPISFIVASGGGFNSRGVASTTTQANPISFIVGGFEPKQTWPWLVRTCYLNREQLRLVIYQIWKYPHSQIFNFDISGCGCPKYIHSFFFLLFKKTFFPTFLIF